MCGLLCSCFVLKYFRKPSQHLDHGTVDGSPSLFCFFMPVNRQRLCFETFMSVCMYICWLCALEGDVECKPPKNVFKFATNAAFESLINWLGFGCRGSD